MASEGTNTRYDLRALAAQPNVELVAVEAAPATPWGQRSLARLVSQRAVDLLHSPTYTLPVGLPCRVVATVHDLIPRAMPEALPRLAQRAAYRVLTRLAVTVADRLIADSEATRRDLARFLGARGARAAVVPLGVSASFRPCPPPEVADTLGLLGIDRPYVLYVGTNKPHKNLSALLTAWCALPEAVRGAHVLVWAGAEDARYPAVRRAGQSQEGETVRALGTVPEAHLAALYSGATCAVHPSLYEGFGLPVLEAMACGTPVICAARSSLPEVAGDAACLFDPAQPESLGQAMSRLLGDADLRRQLAGKGLARARQYTWERTAELTLAVYRDTVGG
ncbi:MAG: glycosyltransferase family 4 protein [Chloroflexi bacterium]|nr:glycosyltransferase family 4 protein [Chloroflexota bacterium]